MAELIAVKYITKELTSWFWRKGEQVTYTEDMKIFTLQSKSSTYAMAVLESGLVCHLYYGKKIADDDLSHLLRLDENPWTPKMNKRDLGVIMDALPFEYPSFGVGDYREPCLEILDKNGMSSCKPLYQSHTVYKGKPKLEGLPATFADENQAETLELICADERAGLEITLIYTVFKDLDVITRSVKIKNAGSDSINIRRALSACVDFDADEFDMLTLNGSWARERFIERARLHCGKQGIDSARGASSHQHNPFAALISHHADEDSGEAYGFNFVYSGGFFAQAEVTQHRKTRFVMGINHIDFEWLLEAGEAFQTPEVVMVYSDQGLGQMSRTFHDLYRNHLVRGQWKDKRRPVLINCWEAAYFDFNSEKLVGIAKQAAELGMELFVMDDGWFGRRNSDDSSLGDWFVNEEKITGGLAALVNEVNRLGLKFGIWFEPEMVSPDSDLYRARPDWAIQVKGRELTLVREQYVLDFSRADVRDYVYGMMKKILDGANIEYVKWDMNRQMTEVGSAALPAKRQRELWHRYMLGVYEFMERLTADYPHILLESCAGGGGRFDAGMLYYAPQIWCSDNTDAAERLKIQRGTSICYPPLAIGAHVSDCPNHIVGRTTPFAARGHVAMFGAFGYELDVTKISEEDKNAIPAQIEEYKKYNHLVREGDLYRIGDVRGNNAWEAWGFVAKDKSEAAFTFVQMLSEPNYGSRRVKLKGLAPDAFYKNEETGEVLSGSALMNAGINIALHGDFASKILRFAKQ